MSSNSNATPGQLQSHQQKEYEESLGPGAKDEPHFRGQAVQVHRSSLRSSHVGRCTHRSMPNEQAPSDAGRQVIAPVGYCWHSAKAKVSES